MKKRILKYKVAVCVGLAFLAITSCSDWLDVKPKTEVEADKLFDTENGFKEALAGIYTSMTQEDLYGRELTFGLVDAVAQQWKLTSEDNSQVYYDAAVNYDYQSTVIRPLVDTIWLQMYQTIANVNSILEFVDDKEVFTGDNRTIIKGEALAIRAYLHFDLLRLFAKDAVSTSAEEGIPYVNELTKLVTRSISPKEVMTHVVADLQAALKCLENDPILTGREITGDDDHGYLMNRNYHLNYYAVAGLLARVELYARNYSEAAKYARMVIDAHRKDGKFPWIDKSDVATGDNKEARDRTFSTEHLFALNIRKLTSYTDEYLTATTKPLKVRLGQEVLFPVAELRTYQFEDVKDLPTKLLQVEGSEFGERMPMIKLAEMYYILAECENYADLTTEEGAVNLLNEVLTARAYEAQNLLDPTVVQEMTSVQEEILKEYQREFICEGQLFFYHKRQGDMVLNERPVNYVFPKPELELEFGK